MTQISHFPNCITTTPEKNIPLTTFLQAIKTGTYEEEIKRYRQLLKVNGKNSPRTKEFKKTNLPAVTYAGTFKKRKAQGLITSSNLIIIDIDNWLEPQRLKERLSRDPYLMAAFISPGEAGLKLLFQGDFFTNSLDYKKQYTTIIHYLTTEYKLPIASREKPEGLDTSCSDMSRLCFYSHDPELYFNSSTQPFPMDFLQAGPFHNSSYGVEKIQQPATTQDQIEAITCQIESRCLDITSGYHNWLTIGFALESELAEAGREYFQRISQFHPTYKHAQCDKQYYYIQKSKGTGITIKTFFSKAKEHGLNSIPKEANKKQKAMAQELRELPEVEEVEEEDQLMNQWINPKETPAFPLEVFPPVLKEFIQASAESINCPPDFIAVPMLTALGVAIGTSRIVEIKKGWTESARIYSAIVAEPGSRKTPALNLATSPILQLQQEYAKAYYQKKRNFEEALKNYEHKQDKSETKEPKTTTRPTPPQMK